MEDLKCSYCDICGAEISFVNDEIPWFGSVNIINIVTDEKVHIKCDCLCEFHYRSYNIELPPYKFDEMKEDRGVL